MLALALGKILRVELYLSGDPPGSLSRLVCHVALNCFEDSCGRVIFLSDATRSSDELIINLNSKLHLAPPSSLPQSLALTTPLHSGSSKRASGL
jgi:hypothetical protein